VRVFGRVQPRICLDIRKDFSRSKPDCMRR
jgi:hypothetical protein